METKEKIEVVVKIVGYLERYLSGDQNEFKLKLRKDSTILDLFDKLEIPENEIKYIMILVNGHQVNKETNLNSEDRISLLTPVDGG
jgi:sulfur carrier protein ThiS